MPGGGCKGGASTQGFSRKALELGVKLVALMSPDTSGMSEPGAFLKGQNTWNVDAAGTLTK